MCLGAIRMHTLRQVHYAARDPVAGSAALATATPYYQRGQIQLHGPENPELERVLVALHTIFILKIGGRWDRLAEEQASSDYMAGVTFGRELFRSGEWEGLVKGGWPVAEALNALAAPRNSVVSR